MVINGKDRNYKTMFCKCGCGNGVVLKAYNDKNFGVSLQLVSDNFFSGHNNRRSTFKEKIKRIWYIIVGKEYRYFDLLIEPEELLEFKEFVARL